MKPSTPATLSRHCDETELALLVEALMLDGDRRPECKSARGPNADRRAKCLIDFATMGSMFGAYLQLTANNPLDDERHFR